MDRRIIPTKVFFCVFVCLVLVLIPVAQPAVTLPAAPPWPDAEGARASSSAIVTLIVDRNDDTTGSPACTAAPDDCSLRDAIEIANADPANFYNIYFYADYTITLNSPLTIVATSLYIWGAGPDGIAPRTIRIDAGGHAQAFIINTIDVHLSELRIYGAANGASNIWIMGSAYGITLSYNVIGDSDPADGCQTGSPLAYGGVYVNATGASPGPFFFERAWIYGNTIECNGGASGNGIDVVNTNDVVIGANPRVPVAPSRRNYIRSNAGHGVNISGANATHNIVSYNSIGVNNAGSAAATPPNARNGIYVGELASSIVITGNLISGNGAGGVWLRNAQFVTVTNNVIGTNLNGTAAIPNAEDGVAISDGAHDNSVGITGDVVSSNLISGNTLCGVWIGMGATANIVDGNRIGLNAAGNGAVPNGAGACIVSADGNWIGTSQADTVQFISGNLQTGVSVVNASGNFVGATNLIGVATDAATPLGNGMEGVRLLNATNTFVGPQVVANNGGAGIAVEGAASAGNLISPFFVDANRGLPVDLNNDGPTPNDPGDADSGPNALLNYPVVTSRSGNTITGTACANCKIFVYRAIGNPARPGGGAELLAYLTATANASGVWSVTLPGGAVTPASISLQACAPPCGFSGNSSELRPRPVVYVPLALRDYR